MGVNGYQYTIKAKKKFVVASRDFALNMIHNIEEDGTVVICTSSDNFKGDCPEKPSTVRAQTPLSGYILKPEPGNPRKVHMTIVNELNLMGHIPDFVLRIAFKDQGF